MKKPGFWSLLSGLLTSISAFSQPQGANGFLEQFMKGRPEFDSVLRYRHEWNVQIIYSAIDRRKKGPPTITDHYFNVDDQRYYYPASTVKLPIVLLSLQRLHELNIPGLDLNSTMITGSAGGVQTEVLNDPSSPDGRPTIAHYIKKILLVSDNDAFNRLYEFLGQEYINNTLQKLGYQNCEIVHRLDVSLPEAENRRTNPVSFYDSTGKLIYTKPATQSEYVYSRLSNKIGSGFMRGGLLVNEPMDFSTKNRLPLSSLHKMVRNVIFPSSIPEKERFGLRDSDLEFVRSYMGMMPFQSASPVYDTSEYWDTYVKFLYYGSEPNTSQPWMKIFNKVGDAYGFLIDGAYLHDTKNDIDFFLSAAIYCNSDGILNDDHYDYDSIGFPFLKSLGRAIHEWEVKQKARRRK